MQSQAQGSPLAKARLGDVRQGDARFFAPLEARLRGADAVDAFIQLLRLRLGSRETAGSEVAGSELVNHGPEVQPVKPLLNYRMPDTSGVQ